MTLKNSPRKNHNHAFLPVFCAQRAQKCSEQEKDSAVRPVRLNRSREVFDALFQLRNASVRLLVCQDGLGDEVWQQQQQ